MVLAEQPPEFVVCWIALVALGLFLGWFSCYFLPWSWYLRDERRLTEEELRAQHPGKAWVTLPPWLLPIICGLVTIVLIIGKVAHTGESSLLEAFFLPLTFLVGFNVSVAIMEIFAGVSTVLPLGHGRHGPMPYIVSLKVRVVGLYRIVLAVILFTAFFYLAH